VIITEIETIPKTMQISDFSVSENGKLFLLPDPVTCYLDASYDQIQTFHLQNSSSSLIVLDWITSGRRSLGENWVFKRYYTLNEVFLNGRRIVRDIMLLENDAMSIPTSRPGKLADRLAPYSCYATLILYGPLLEEVNLDLQKRQETTVIMKVNVPTDLIWSLSSIEDCNAGLGTVVRIAGKGPEVVKHWIGDVLINIQETIGIDVFRRIFR
jgi:urease accessory protein